MKPVVPKPQRCAIYTRKSTEHNLDLEFNSLDAQREACEAYIKSQAHEGWRLVPQRYDDGGLSGASLDRPALQNLLADVRAGNINTVVVYKVDRLTRSLADFAKLVELFDQQLVSFVSITQSFNTTSSMGRLTLNVPLSFAQFEREVIGERVRDKIAASKRKGLWVGGPVPLGYRCLDKKLEIVREEAEVVRAIFSWYLDLGSMGALIAELDRQGIRTKINGRRDGRKSGGIRFGVGSLAICSRTGSTSAKSPIGVRCIAASMSRFSPATYLRLCRPSASPTPSPGMFGSEALRPFWLVASSTTAATG
jgi:site-specific DNA recombinase